MHVNALRVVSPDYYGPSDPNQKAHEVPFLGYTGQTPWLRRKVLIESPGDPHNKEQGVVKDVLLSEKGKETESTMRVGAKGRPIKLVFHNGIRVQVQFTRIRDHVPVQTYHYEEVVDWEYVSLLLFPNIANEVNCRTRWPLRIACPLNGHQLHFSTLR